MILREKFKFGNIRNYLCSHFYYDTGLAFFIPPPIFYFSQRMYSYEPWNQLFRHHLAPGLYRSASQGSNSSGIHLVDQPLHISTGSRSNSHQGSNNSLNEVGSISPRSGTWSAGSARSPGSNRRTLRRRMRNGSGSSGSSLPSPGKVFSFWNLWAYILIIYLINFIFLKSGFVISKRKGKPSIWTDLKGLYLFSGSALIVLIFVFDENVP